MAQTVRKLFLTLFWFSLRCITIRAPSGWRKSRKPNDLGFM